MQIFHNKFIMFNSFLTFGHEKAIHAPAQMAQTF